MKGKFLLVMWLIVLLVISLFINCGSSIAQAQQKVIHWKGQNEYPEENFLVPGIKGKSGLGAIGSGLANWIKEITNGRLVIDLAPAGSIVPTAEGLKAVGRGALDIISVTTGAYWTGTVPESNFETGPPYAWLTVPELYEFMYLRGAYDIMHETYLKHNVYWLPQAVGGPYAIFSKSPLRSVSDLKGKKIRAIGAMGNFFKGFGASPTVIPAAESYMALKLGTVDAAYFGAGMLRAGKLQEVVSYCVYSPVPIGSFGSTIINLDKWKALPSDIRDLLEKNMKYFNLSTLMSNDTFAWQVVWLAQREAGVTPVAWPDSDLPLLMEKAVPIWDEMGTYNENCAKLLKIVKEQARDRNRIK